MILLPPVRPAYLKSFALGFSCFTALLVFVFSWWLEFEGSIRVAALVAIGGSTLGLAQPMAMNRVYRHWNSSARFFARGARWLLMAICFYIILAAVGRTGSTLKLSRTAVDGSLWTPKKPLSPGAFRHEFAAISENSGGESWLGNFHLWAKESKQIWAVALIPFLAMLAAVEVYNDRRFPTGVYTLF